MKNDLEITFTCINCDSCRQICPEGSIVTEGSNYAIDPWSCINCELCVKVCPVNAIKPSAS